MNALNSLIDALRCLPGIGPKSAQRMAFYLLQHQRRQGLQLAESLQQAMNSITHCQLCNNYTEFPICSLCTDSNRNSSLLCVVESPIDVLAIEQSHSFQGRYFVLMGKISPLDGVGPEDLNFSKLKQLINEQPIQEVILALSLSVEGQTTAHFIHQLMQKEAIQVTQLAHGIPVGGELEFLDEHTIGSALRNRAAFSHRSQY